MAAVLSLEPRFTPRFTEPQTAPRLRLVEPRRQPDPRFARRQRRAVYHRRRVLAALVGLGLVLTVARAGAALGGSILASPGRLPHVEQVVVQPGDSLWSIARRVAPGHDLRPIVDAMSAQLGSSLLVAGETVSVPAP